METGPRQFIEEDLEIEWIIVADSAEVVNGKIYMLGGGWNRTSASRNEKDSRQFAIALSVLVPWHRTNQKHQFTVQVVDEDGHNALAQVSGQLETGRPVGAIQGQAIRVPMAFKIVTPLLKPGTYTVSGSVDGRPSGHTTFAVVPRKGASSPPSGPAQGR